MGPYGSYWVLIGPYAFSAIFMGPKGSHGSLLVLIDLYGHFLPLLVVMVL